MLMRQLGLSELLEELLPPGREEIPWSAMIQVLVLGRLLDPSSELHLANACSQRMQNPLRVARQVGRLLGRNSRAAALFQVDVEADAQGCAHLRWTKLVVRRASVAGKPPRRTACGWILSWSYFFLARAAQIECDGPNALYVNMIASTFSSSLYAKAAAIPRSRYSMCLIGPRGVW